ncbi:MAG: alpha-L-rhamnosidase N-terminal domain-containing protein, partial [Paludibacteraceae bacterium]
MRIKLIIIFILFIVFPFAVVRGRTACTPVNLMIDYLENPIGIDNPFPRFAWKLDDGRKNAKQLAYRLLVGTDSLEVLMGKGNIWDTGRLISDEILKPFSGNELKPFTQYFWKVTVWDKDKKGNSSRVQSFETGMMKIENWEGTWISDGQNKDELKAPYFRKEFEITKKMKSARAYIVVAGLYELYINGKKVGNHRLDPMYTRYDKRNLYVTYDITSQLQQGKNVVGVLLGNGWYNHQSKAVWDFDQAPWRNRPAFSMNILIKNYDKTTTIIPSDLTWKTASGGLIFNSIYTGEHFNANLEH